MKRQECYDLPLTFMWIVLGYIGATTAGQLLRNQVVFSCQGVVVFYHAQTLLIVQNEELCLNLPAFANLVLFHCFFNHSNLFHSTEEFFDASKEWQVSLYSISVYLNIYKNFKNALSPSSRTI